MPRFTDSDHCSRCKKYVSRELVTVKTIQFTELPDRTAGARRKAPKVLKQRTVDYLCEKCRDADPEWNIPAFSGPGHTSPALERTRQKNE